MGLSLGFQQRRQRRVTDGFFLSLKSCYLFIKNPIEK
jgi:hypothetical protein